MSQKNYSNKREVRRILLVQPPIHSDSLVLGHMEPLGLETLAAAIPEEIEIRILDLRVEAQRSIDRGLTGELLRFSPDMVGVTGITIDFPEAVNVLRTVRRMLPGALTVAGGHHASVCPEDYFIPEVDFIVRGSGVRAFPLLLDAIVNGSDFSDIQGLAFRKDGEFHPASDFAEPVQLARTPLPRRELVERYRKKYSFYGTTMGLITTSQGCPNRCTFCACWIILNGKYTARPVEDVVKELVSIPEKHVFFGDDHTFGNVRRAYHLYEAIRDAELDKTFEAYSRADTIVNNPDLFRKWASIGLTGLTVGYEALNDDSLDVYNKEGSVEINRRANDILLACGITNFAHFLIRPDFTGPDFQAITDYGRELGIIHPIYAVLTPLPGTPLHRQSPEIHPDMHPYYDLAHPLLPRKLSSKSFYREYRALYARNYSVGRLLTVWKRKLVNLFTGKYRNTPAMLMTPNLLSIIMTRWVLARQFYRGSKQLKKFIERCES
jgi:hopanoid C-3 methylase